MHAVFGQPLGCLLCKYEALNSIETSLEKQERKNRDRLEVIHHSASTGNLSRDVPELPPLALRSPAIELGACLEADRRAACQWHKRRRMAGARCAPLCPGAF